MSSVKSASTITALAAAVGVKRQAVQTWIKRPEWKFGKQGPWNIADVRRWRAATFMESHRQRGTKTKAARKPSPPQPPATAAAEPDATSADAKALDVELKGMDAEKAARIRLLLARASSVEFDRQVKGGRYLRREDVERGRVARIHAVRSRLQALPRQAASDLVGLDETQIESVLREHCDAICTAFADG